jgi:hypothetical protein
MQQSLLDRLVELIKRDYPEDWARLCHHAHPTEPDLSPEEAARRCLRSYQKRDVLDPMDSLVMELLQADRLCRDCIQLFVDAVRSRMVGRIEGTLKMKRLDPALITTETLRFDPDELVLDEGKLIVVNVRVESAPVVDATVGVASVEESPAAARNPGGAPPVADWGMVDQEVFRLMDENGEFIDGDPEWNAQARLEKAISDYCETTFHVHPSGNTVRTHVRKALKLWRQRRTET